MINRHCGVCVNKFEANAKSSMVDRRVGRKLREARERLGESPQNVAQALKIKIIDYLQAESGLRRLGPEPLARAAELLRVSLPWFFEGSTANDKVEDRSEPSLSNVVDLNAERARGQLK